MVKTEFWVKGVVKDLKKKEDGSFLDGVLDYSQYENNDVLHLTTDSIQPEVLINNTTYPIPVQSFQDGEVVISLDKFVTKVTQVTDDELEACTYDKISLTKTKHVNAINASKFGKAIHALCPDAHTAETPIIKTSGEDDGTGRKRLTRKDIIALKDAYDGAGFSEEGRRLVLSSQHVNDLLLEDKEFRALYTNHKTGAITNLYGFEIYTTISAPYITLSTLKKKSFGSIPAEGDFKASVSFLVGAACKATGKTRMYYRDAKTSPEYQSNLVNFRHRFIALPIQKSGIGAIV